MTNLELLRMLGRSFIWLGAVSCAIYLLLGISAIGSFSGALLTLIEVISRLSATVGLGAVLLALTEVVLCLDAIARRTLPDEEKHS